MAHHCPLSLRLPKCPLALGCPVSQWRCSWPRAETYWEQLPCREVRQGQRNAHHTVKGNRVPSQRPFIWATMTSPLLLQCPVTFFWYLWLSASLLNRAHSPWCISYLEGKTHLPSQEESALPEWQLGEQGRGRGWFDCLASEQKGCSSGYATGHSWDAARGRPARSPAMQPLWLPWGRRALNLSCCGTQMRCFHLTKVWHP